MKRLYAPWRSNYATKKDVNNDELVDQKNCIFCKQITSNTDARYLILGRYNHTIAMLNLYPYNAGHILVLPYAHHADLTLLSSQELCEFMTITSKAQAILKQELNAHGINIGLNLGKIAGASIPSHLHMHIIPRWLGDTNFLPLIADTKQISVNLEEVYQKLLPFFHTIQK